MASATRTPQNKNNHCARAFMFLYISLPSPAKQQCEMTKFKASRRTSAHDGEFFVLLPYLNAVSINLVPAYSVHNEQVEQIVIIAKWQKFRKVTFSRDVFVAVSVAAAKAPQ